MKASDLQQEKIISARNIEKEYILLVYHDLAFLPNSLADPAASARETWSNLVPKLNMRERHTSLQVLIVQAQNKSEIKDQNLRWAGIDILPRGRPHTEQYQFRLAIPRMVCVRYPNQEHPRAL
jgi:hypothetical protein